MTLQLAATNKQLQLLKERYDMDIDGVQAENAQLLKTQAEHSQVVKQVVRVVGVDPVCH